MLGVPHGQTINDDDTIGSGNHSYACSFGWLNNCFRSTAIPCVNPGLEALQGQRLVNVDILLIQSRRHHNGVAIRGSIDASIDSRVVTGHINDICQNRRRRRQPQADHQHQSKQDTRCLLHLLLLLPSWSSLRLVVLLPLDQKHSSPSVARPSIRHVSPSPETQNRPSKGRFHLLAAHREVASQRLRIIAPRSLFSPPCCHFCSSTLNQHI